MTPALQMIRNISDTARWVAYYRAMETRRPDRVFDDPFAERLAGPEGAAIVDTMPRGRQMAWAMIVRTASFDQLVMEAVRGRQADLVVNLAAGLDARPWRLDLPRDLRWIDVDLPDILDYKLAQLSSEPTRCRYEAIRADLTDDARRRALLQQLGGSASRALVISEGLLIYLTPEQVGALATDLHDAGSFRWWIIDIAHPRLLKMMEKTWGKAVKAGNAPFKFAPAESTDFFRRYGWAEQTFLSSMEEARRIDRQMRGAAFWRFVMRFYPKRLRDQFRRFSGAAMLERT